MDIIIQYKSDGTSIMIVKDCTNYCDLVGQGTHENLNYGTFTYTVSGNTVTQTVQGQIVVCGTPKAKATLLPMALSLAMAIR